MRRKRFSFVLSMLAIVALVCSLGLLGCGKGSRSQSTQAGNSSDQEVVNNAAAEEEAQESEAQEATEDSSEQPNAAEDADESSSSDQSGGKEATDESGQDEAGQAIDENGEYSSKDEVALYLHTYGHLPGNYVTKHEAEDAGWKTKGLSLWEACPGKSIGGDRFGNREGRLPKASGRTWYECDIDYAGERSRNAKRILYSNDGLIYYTEDHYKTFEKLY